MARVRSSEEDVYYRIDPMLWVVRVDVSNVDVKNGNGRLDGWGGWLTSKIA